MQNARIQIPYSPPEEYDLMVVAVRKSGLGELAVGLVHKSAQFVALLDGWGSTISGLDLVDGKLADVNGTARKGSSLIPQGKPVTILCSVRKAGVTVTVDEEEILSWKGDYSKLSLRTTFQVRNPNALFLVSFDSSMVFKRMLLTPVSGRGKNLR